MKKIINFTLICGLVLLVGACSSRKPTEEGEEVADGTPAAATDAGTDAVPQEGVENVANSPTDAPAAGDLAQAPPAPSAAADPAPTSGAPLADTSVPASPAGSGSFDEYRVQPGDTLMKVAFEIYGDLYRWKGILDANKDKVTDPNHIPAGTVLKVERPMTVVVIEKNGEKYMIKTGDTLGTISKDVYGTQGRWKALWENNKQMIHDPNRIFAGFYLYYQPDAKSSKPGDAPMTSPQPFANTGSGTGNTATTTGDQSRAPASNGAPDGTATR